MLQHWRMWEVSPAVAALMLGGCTQPWSPALPQVSLPARLGTWWASPSEPYQEAAHMPTAEHANTSAEGSYPGLESDGSNKVYPDTPGQTRTPELACGESCG